VGTQARGRATDRPCQDELGAHFDLKREG
jgi:hypothetical protein